MYNLNGILECIDYPGIFYILIGVTALVLTIKWRKEGIKKSDLIIAILTIALGIYQASYHIYVYNNPIIRQCEDYYVGRNKTRMSIYKDLAVRFEDNRFYIGANVLDDEIRPQGLKKGKLYRIWYEERTDIIVRIEEIT